MTIETATVMLFVNMLYFVPRSPIPFVISRAFLTIPSRMYWLSHRQTNSCLLYPSTVERCFFFICCCYIYTRAHTFDWCFNTCVEVTSYCCCLTVDDDCAYSPHTRYYYALNFSAPCPVLWNFILRPMNFLTSHNSHTIIRTQKFWTKIQIVRKWFFEFNFWTSFGWKFIVEILLEQTTCIRM